MNSPEKRFDPVKKSKVFNRILSTFKLRKKKVLDLGCSFGEFLSLFGPGSVGITTTLAEVEYGKKHRLNIKQGNVELIDKIGIKESFDAIWANNLFEHLLAPHAFLIKLKTVAKDDTILLLGVPTIPRCPSLMRITAFRGALATAHVNFFTRESLRLTVQRAGWKVLDIRPFVTNIRWLDRLCSFFAPHLYVVAVNDRHFRYHDKKLMEWKDDAHYQDILKIVKNQ
ncbi:MAG TPA: class I SAM-dependent methyltransferase [Acidobacteriota bacterium]|nr:class I SAM-dependent methyltransferase [Acidobacteriota bacterium]